MQTIALTSLTNDFYSGVSGMKVGKAIDKALQQGAEQISVSFYGVEAMGPSFVNGAFIYPMELYGADYLRSRLKLVNAKPSIANMVGSSLKSFALNQQEFYDKIKTNTVYIAAYGNYGKALREKLHEGVQYDIHVEYNKSSVFTSRAEQAISASNFFIGVIGDASELQAVLVETNYAIAQSKKVLLLSRKGICVKIPGEIQNRVQIVYFDTENAISVIRGVNKFVLERKVIPPNRKQSASESAQNVAEIAGAAALGAAAVLLLAALFGNNKDK